MTTVVLGFPGGLYHATPWGNHVNEGLVEWPPSPWRLLRALISVGHTAFHWDDGVPSAARVLVDALASGSPHYTLPPAGTAHARHYMPIDGGKTSLVFDAFARPGGGELSVTWPVRLEPDQRTLLEALVSHLNYLGRSESWVEGRLLDEGEAPPRGEECTLSQPGDPPRHGWEQIFLLGVEPAHTYEAWRAERAGKSAAVSASNETGKRRRRRASAAATPRVGDAPETLWDCLVQTTSDLQAAGWSLPPGSRRQLYWRRKDALVVAPPMAIRRPSPARPEVILLSLALSSGNLQALPPVTRTLPQAELLHRAVVRSLARGEMTDAGLELVGRDPGGALLSGHQHAHTLPLDLDEDGHLDHILFWAPGGFSPEARAAVRGLRTTYAKGVTDLRLAVAAVGSLSSLVDLPGRWGDGLRAVLGPAKSWISATPFLPPRFLKRSGRNTLEGQVQAELRSRGLPEATSIQSFTRDEVLAARFRHFERERRRGGDKSKTGYWFGLKVSFDEPVCGPLCLGYASHYGMGRLRTIRDSLES